jgi:hypothetical protein
VMNLTEREQLDRRVRESPDLSASVIGYAMEAIVAIKNEVRAEVPEIPNIVADWKPILVRTTSLCWPGECKLKLRQPLPPILRHYPPPYGRWQSRFFRAWSKLFLRKKAWFELRTQTCLAVVRGHHPHCISGEFRSYHRQL